MTRDSWRGWKGSGGARAMANLVRLSAFLAMKLEFNAGNVRRVWDMVYAYLDGDFDRRRLLKSPGYTEEPHSNLELSPVHYLWLMMCH